MSDQLALGVEPEVSPVRVRALAGVLAGFEWPERGSFEKLTKAQQALAEDVARRALVGLKA